MKVFYLPPGVIQHHHPTKKKSARWLQHICIKKKSCGVSILIFGAIQQPSVGNYLSSQELGFQGSSGFQVTVNPGYSNLTSCWNFGSVWYLIVGVTLHPIQPTRKCCASNPCLRFSKFPNTFRAPCTKKTAPFARIFLLAPIFFLLAALVKTCTSDFAHFSPVANGYVGQNYFILANDLYFMVWGKLGSFLRHPFVLGIL